MTKIPFWDTMTSMSLKGPAKNLLEKFVPVLLVLTVLLAFAVGVLWQKVANLEGGKVKSPTASGQAAATPDANGKLAKEEAKKLIPVSDKDHILGNKDAEIKLVVYSDLECPFCKKFHETAKQAISDYNGKVAMVYRHFPLYQLHSQAETESIATECVASIAGEDIFWKYVDKIFAVTPSNNGLDLTQLPKYATNLGVDGTKFQNCLDTKEFKDKVTQQAAGGETIGVTGTPASFVVNKKGEVWEVPGAVPLETLKATIDLALK